MSKSIQQLEYELKNAKARIEELELREQSQLVELTLHSQILQNMSEGVYMVSADDSAIVYANPVFEKMFGYEHGELVGKHVSIVNAPDTHPEKTASDIIGYLEKTGRWQGEIKNIKKDGTVFWCLANVSLYKSSQYGSVYISVHQDITQQKKIEGELAKKSEFENRLFETAQVIILVLDTEGRIVNINPYMESKTGYKLDEIVGKDWFDTFIPGPDQKAIRELFRTCIHDIKTNGNINPILTKNGELIDVEWYDSTLKDSKGSVIGLLAIGQDVTEKRKSQIEHQKTLGSLIEIQNAMDLIGLGIHMVTMDGEFLYVNDAAANMLGYSKQELLGKGIEGIDPNYTKESFSRVTSSLRCNNPGKIETTQLSKNGVLIPVEVAFHYFPETTNRPEHFISFLTDLTERKAVDAENKKLQQQLLQSQKMEAIGHLTGGIAHDFNNMLAAILGYAGLIENDLMDELKTRNKSKDYLDQIMLAANRARELIGQMLIFSRQSSDDVADVPVIELQPVVKEVVNLLKSSIPATINISLNVINDDLHAQINSVQLHQVILNLGINARDAIDNYGHINISLQKQNIHDVCMSCHNEFNGDYAEIIISDTGSGIPVDKLARIFEPFYTTKEIGKGTGMGLSVVHGVIHANGGHILVSNNTNKGLTVRILLPLIEISEVKDNKDEVLSDIDNQLSGLRIMIVDDERQIASMMGEIFEMHGAEAIVYNRSADALDYFKGHPYEVDLILTDETMPGLSGLDMSKSMLAIRSNLPIIISTGYSEHVNPKIARQHGISGFMMKPVKIENLLAMISDLTLSKN